MENFTLYPNYYEELKKRLKKRRAKRGGDLK